MSDAYCKKHFISYTGINPDLQLVRKCPDVSKNCPHCRIAELEARLDAVAALPEKWRKRVMQCHAVTAYDQCAAELEQALEQEDESP